MTPASSYLAVQHPWPTRRLRDGVEACHSHGPRSGMLCRKPSSDSHDLREQGREWRRISRLDAPGREVSLFFCLSRSMRSRQWPWSFSTGLHRCDKLKPRGTRTALWKSCSVARVGGTERACSRARTKRVLYAWKCRATSLPTESLGRWPEKESDWVTSISSLIPSASWVTVCRWRAEFGFSQFSGRSPGKAAVWLNGHQMSPPLASQAENAVTECPSCMLGCQW